MGLRVYDNVVARSVRNVLVQNEARTSRSISEISSGQRINRARDDAAGQAISEKFGAQVRGLAQATGNAQDGIFLLQKADASMGEVQSILQRMRELAVQASTDTLTAADRGHVTDELRMLSEEITRIGEASEYNTRKLLDGTMAAGGFALQVGANAGDVLDIRLDTVSSANLGVLTTEISVANASNASVTISRLDAAIDKLSRFRGGAGSTINRLEHAMADLGVMSAGMAGARSRIQDLDMARAATQLATSQLLTQSGTAMLAQASAQPQSVLALLR